MFKCRLNSTKKVIRILICHILILSMFFSVVSPSNAEDQGFDAANGVAYSQEHLRGVLEADLSQYQGERIPFDPSEYEESQPLPKNEDQPWEGERTPDAYDIDRYGDAGIDNMSDTGLSRSLSDISTANEASDSGVGSPYDTLLGRGFTETGKPISRKELWQDQTYETDRFIVKYKENASRETVEASLLSSNLVEAVDKISKFDNPQAGLKGEILKNNGSQISRGDVASIEDFASILKTHEAITAEDLTRRLDDAALLEIEYIQPDYEMAFYSLGEEEPFGNIEDDESLTIGQDDPPDLATTQDNGIVVALLDTGIDTNHPALAGKLTAGYDFVNNTENVNSEEWYYDQGHGTSLAGVIASAGAAVMPLKVFEGGKAYTSDIISAIIYAEENGAAIANMSFGTRFYNPALFEAISNSNMLFVCASGNMLVNIDNYPVYPAAFDLPNVLTVSSVTEEDKHARFSNYGVLGVDIAAPGENILVPWLDSTYVTTQGTSVSAAIVSSASALTLAAHSSLDAVGLKARMVQSADQITGLTDKIHDGKRLNVDYAVSDEAGPNETILDVPDPDPIPDIMLDDEIDEEYEEFGADGLVTYKNSMLYAREGLGVAAVGKKIYAIGGRSDNTIYEYLEIYDTETDIWSNGPNMPYGVSNFACVAVGTKIYCIGGYNGGYCNYVQVYNTVSNSWSVMTALSVSLMGVAAVEYNGSIYISGGYNSSYQNTVYQYNISANTWTKRPNLYSSRAYHNAFVYNGKMYIEGGANSPTGFYVDTEEVYDLSNYSVSTGGSSRVYGMNSAVISKDNRLVIIGGSAYLNNCYSRLIIQRSMFYDNNTYTRVNAMSVARGSLGAAMVDGVVYIIGGKNSGGALNTVEAVEAGYKELAAMPFKLRGFAAVGLFGDIFMAGGYKMPGNTLSREMYAYNVYDKAWRKLANLPGGYGDGNKPGLRKALFVRL